MDDWGWEHLALWSARRLEFPSGRLFCIISGPTAGRRWPQTGARVHLRRLASQAGVRRRFAPHQLRHAHAVEMARDGVPLNVVQRQLGHSNVGVTSIHCRGSTVPRSSTPSTIGARR